MRLHLTDIALERARLALAASRPHHARPYIDEAAAFIAATGYHRRDPDLAALRARLSSTLSGASPGSTSV